MQCTVAPGVVGLMVLPAVPDDVDPGPIEDADGVRVVVASAVAWWHLGCISSDLQDTTDMHRMASERGALLGSADLAGGF